MINEVSYDPRHAPWAWSFSSKPVAPKIQMNHTKNAVLKQAFDIAKSLCHSAQHVNLGNSHGAFQNKQKMAA